MFTRIDTQSLKESVDIAAVIEADLGHPQAKSGRWSMWRCPFHVGKRVDMGVADGTYYCFGCGETGDVFSWLCKFRRLTFKEACEVLSAGKFQPSRFAVPTQPAKGRPEAQQESWKRIVEDARKALEGQQKAQAWLAERGISMETARLFCIGYAGDLQSLGLNEAPNTHGILLPCIDRLDCNWISYVKVRRPNDNPKYKKLPGHGASLFGIFGSHLARGAEIVFVCEGELDAALLWQEAGDMVGVITTGAVSDKLPPAEMVKALGCRPRYLFAAHDNDPAGEEGASEFIETYSGAIRARPTAGKDITDMWKAGINLGEWVLDLIKTNAPEAAR